MKTRIDNDGAYFHKEPTGSRKVVRNTQVDEAAVLHIVRRGQPGENVRDLLDMLGLTDTARIMLERRST